MLELQQDLLTLTQDVRIWLTQHFSIPVHSPVTQPHLSPVHVLTSPAIQIAPQNTPTPPIAIEPDTLPDQTQVEISFPQLRDWAKGLFSMIEPITPIVCLGDHPLLVKLASAMTEKFLPAMCCTHLPPLNHPLLKLILIPVPLLKKFPELQHLTHLKPHDLSGSVLLLHPLEVYIHHSHEKRLLWNIIQKLPLFC